MAKHIEHVYLQSVFDLAAFQTRVRVLLLLRIPRVVFVFVVYDIHVVHFIYYLN